MKISSRVFALIAVLALALNIDVAAYASGEESALKRGEFITALFELSGADETAAEQNYFADVPTSGRLAQAVRWAAENGVINGCGNGSFMPEAPVTLEQLAAMLYRNAEALGQTPQGGWIFPLGYADAAEVSAWADKAVQWAVMNQIIIDTDEALEPQSAVKSGQLPALLERWRSFTASEGARDIFILYTSDVHCGVDKGFGYSGLEEMCDALKAQGYDLILVDDGDNIKGEPIGTMTKGEALTQLMNKMGYSVAIPGNHEFDYGMERFLYLADEAQFPYISCNFFHNGELVFEPYLIRELGGKKIAFVGATTPRTFIASTPSFFQNKEGEFVYGFCQDKTGETFYSAVQTAADAARAKGADYVVLMAHLGKDAICSPWTYSEVISHTRGIDVMLDGHSHDVEQDVVNNAQGVPVLRSACGTKMEGVGWCRITPEGEFSTGVYMWHREASAAEALGLDNAMSRAVSDATDELNEKLKEVVAHTKFQLAINDPAEKDSAGRPVRIIRKMETNLGDLLADAFREQADADIAVVNGGGIRNNIEAGDITLGDLLSVQPFSNSLCMVAATGQQILDALEWGARAVPNDVGAFLHVSGVSYEIHSYIPSPCISDENSAFVGVEGERRVKNVLVGGQPIDPEKLYKLASHNYMLLEKGDGFAMLDGAPLLLDCVKLDNQLFIDYIVDKLGGEIGEEYADPYGQGRIKIIETAP